MARHLRSTAAASSRPTETTRTVAALGLLEPEGLLDRVLVVGADDEVQPVLGDRSRSRGGCGCGIPCRAPA
ncbi:MAG: hypothetical protein MZU79_04970 [Anaerotruncus sp.]|nr:hypothetical protein [Anaerotruncus sp.]